MAAADDMRRFEAQTTKMTNDLLAAVAVTILDSIKFGSPLSGAPGQPVDEGTLLNSWELEMDSPTLAVISTPLEYAEPVEDGVGPHGPVVYGAKNGIGGSHSVALTAAAAQKIVDFHAARMTMPDGGAE